MPARPFSVSSFFFNLGRHLGHKAVPAIRKSKLIWDGVAGNEEEALRAEMALGAEMAAELRTTVEVLDNSPSAPLVAQLCDQLIARLRDKRRRFRCHLFRDVSPNAMALPGGFLFLSDSMLELCGNRPEELAFFIGHEMAHVVRGHAWDRMLNEAVLRAASLATARVGQLGGWLRQQGLALLRSAHSREQEFEADELALRLAAAAGFAPEGCIAALQRIQGVSSSTAALGPYLASHPSAPERIARLRAVLRQLGAAPTS